MAYGGIMDYFLVTLGLPREDMTILVDMPELVDTIDKHLLMGEDAQISCYLPNSRKKVNIWVKYSTLAYVVVQNSDSHMIGKNF